MSAIFGSMVPVEDYMEDGVDHEEAFYQARSDSDQAMINARIELENENFTGFTIVEATFIEFDSSNPFHAGAHFDVMVLGLTQDDMDKIYA